MNLDIIAEIAQGFEGKPEQARLLLKAAATAGANAAKYQLVYADELATPDYKYYNLFKNLEMPDETWADLAAYARQLGIELHLDIFGSRSLLLAQQIEAQAIKLHGTDVANMGLLNEVARSSVSKVFLGAGGAHLTEILRAVNLLKNKEVIVLLGFQGYPTPNDANQIARVRYLCEHCQASHPQVRVGFADHALPEGPLRYALAAVAVGAGAAFIEKHLTLGKSMMLEDHESALNPDEFQEFCTVIRESAAALGIAGNGDDFGMSESEQAYRRTIRRHVVASRSLPEGTVISPSDVVLKRTSVDQPIIDLEVVYHRRVLNGIQANSAVLAENID